MPDEPQDDLTLARLRRELLSLIDERDKRYAVEFQSVREAANAVATAAKEAVNAALAAAKEAVQAALAGQEKAVQKAEAAADKRFEGVNEFRGQLADQQRTFIPRQEVEVLHKGINDRIGAEVKGLNDRFGGEIGATNARREAEYAIISKRLDVIEAAMHERAGQFRGQVAGRGSAINVVGVISLVLGILLAIGAAIMRGSK